MIILAFTIIISLHAFISFVIGSNTIKAGNSERKSLALAFAFFSSIYYLIAAYLSMRYFLNECGFYNSTATELSGLGIILGAFATTFIIAPISSLLAAALTLPIFSIMLKMLNHKYEPIDLLEEEKD